MEPTQITILAGFILGLTQLITTNFPKWNKMNITILVTVVVGVIAMSIEGSIGYITIFAALVTEVFGYNLFTKSVVPTIKSVKNVFDSDEKKT